MNKIRIAILGATGSIGRQSLAVFDRNREIFSLKLIANDKNVEKLEEFRIKYNPEKVYNHSTAEDKEYLSKPSTYSDVDLVINGIAGLSGLKPSEAVIKAGKILATANKESIVCYGDFLNELALKTGATIRPVDSEHSTMWQCMEQFDNVKRLIITASGGAFRDLSKSEIKYATGKDALKHPNWNMGKKVTVDCATMVNKGLEIIEAKRLFGIKDVFPVLHRQSIVHSIVEMNDGTLKAGLSVPNMETPIQYAMTYPNRLNIPDNSLDLIKLGALTFEEIDREKYPALKIAEEISNKDGFYSTVFVAADEFLVEKYLQDKISYFDVSKYLSMSLDHISYRKIQGIETILSITDETKSYLSTKIGV